MKRERIRAQFIGVCVAEKNHAVFVSIWTLAPTLSARRCWVLGYVKKGSKQLIVWGSSYMASVNGLCAQNSAYESDMDSNRSRHSSFSSSKYQKILMKLDPHCESIETRCISVFAIVQWSIPQDKKEKKWLESEFFISNIYDGPTQVFAIYAHWRNTSYICAAETGMSRRMDIFGIYNMVY